MGPYLIDSNFLIQAHRGTYPLDVATSFWLKIKQLADDRKIISIDKVKNEIHQYKDQLTNWCEANLADNFYQHSATVMPAYAQVIRAAQLRIPSYRQTALDIFYDAEEADAWLIAHALHLNLPLVTHETSAPEKTTIVKIPDICQLLGVRTLTTVEMFRELGERF